MSPKPFYRRSGVQTLAIVLGLAALYWWSARSVPPASATTVLFDLVLAATALLGGLALTSQFLLPVSTLRERWTALMRLLEYSVGTRGPVLIIRDGEAVEAHDERRRRGAGVILIDHASAAVLRTPTRFTRSVGPGVVFTERGETLAQALDLRIQVRTLHGQPPQPSNESNPTLALTEDGIPISADISVTFLLDPGHNVAPRSGQFPNAPPFEFNPRAAERAVYGETQRGGQPTAWQELALLIAVDLFREEVETWQLEHLLRTRPNEPPALRIISERIGSRLLRTGSSASSGQAPSKASETLTRRGVRVLDVQVSNLQLPHEIRLEHMRRWREEWLTGLEQSLQNARLQASQLREQGAQDGRRFLLEGLTHSLRGELRSGHEPDPVGALAIMIRDALEMLHDPTLEPSASEVRTELQTLETDLRRLMERQPDAASSDES